MSKLALWSIQPPPVQWIGESSPVVKWSGCEAYHSPLSSAKVISKIKNEWSSIFVACLGRTLLLPYTVWLTTVRSSSEIHFTCDSNVVLNNVLRRALEFKCTGKGLGGGVGESEQDGSARSWKTEKRDER